MSQEPRRLAPEVRKAAILNAAKRLLSRVGVAQFSLEAVAREAGVAATLPRHYFGSHSELLMAATVDVLRDVQDALLTQDRQVPLAERLAGCLQLLRNDPWAYSAYMRAPEIHPDLDTAVRRARRRMAEFSFARPWEEMSDREQVHARGWVGYVEAIVGDWIERGQQDLDEILDILLQGGRGLDVKTATARKPPKGRRAPLANARAKPVRRGLSSK